jgi:hypothetical protein
MKDEKKFKDKALKLLSKLTPEEIRRIRDELAEIKRRSKIRMVK